VADEVGKRKVNEREFAGAKGTIGILYWTDLTLKEIEKLKKLNLWTFKLPPPDRVARAINYLADANWLENGVPRPIDEPPRWEHVGPAWATYPDVCPSRSDVKNQSTYRLRMD